MECDVDIPVSIVFTGKMKKIKLTRGYAAIVDDEDYDRVSKIKWYTMGKEPHIYAASGHRTSKKRVAQGVKETNTFITLHRFIIEEKNGEIVDHINRNTLDNRKKNLRLCSQSENLKNLKVRKN